MSKYDGFHSHSSQDRREGGGSQGSYQGAAGLLGARQDIYHMHFSFVFTFPREMFLGPRAHWHSKLGLRRAFASKSSVLPVNLRVWSKGKGHGPDQFPAP